ncbi:choice-of-anchor A family protein [Thiorhodococcus mannitoliphagus]|uniref:Choice-of-anchor A family protein n=1 Tax=Thiorhodococcus mannitoliphagus TaxID=329406 RepID=A0A6P1DV22_9GAMM|nr:choice-of-anchor A family protein [Thiorhodococcus mannitoliphagus]NEX21948.1 choice-of-anchor A family protein [Thiorhodococcus mannitoliphagus]
MRLTKTLLTALLFGSAVNCAQAAFVGPASAYNAFVFGNFTSANSDTEGNLAAGGDVNLQNYSVASSISGSSARLVAGGTVTATNGGVGDGQNGTIYAGGATNLNSFTARGGVQSQKLVDFTAAESQYQRLSTSWGALAANGSTSVESGSLTLNGTDSSLSIFSVDGNDLTGTNSVFINAASGSTVLINITGSGQIFQNGQVTLAGVDAAHVIYNFSDATTLTLDGSKNPFGTVFAPFADVTGGNGALDGQLIAKSFDGNIELHDVSFEGNLPTAVPLPAAAWLFGSALGMIGGIARKRRSS